MWGAGGLGGRGVAPLVAGRIQVTPPRSKEGWAEGGLLGGWTYTGHTIPVLPDEAGALSYLIVLALTTLHVGS